jgi:hypothetical protein
MRLQCVPVTSSSIRVGSYHTFTADARAVVEDRARRLVRRAVGLAAGVSSLAACGAVAFPREAPRTRAPFL